MKVIIAGSRDFDNFHLLEKEIGSVLNSMVNIPMDQFEIVSGGARGADKLGEKFAILNNFKLKVFPADWDTYGKQAGYLRNRQMAEYADMLIAFWDGESKGTKHMVDLANRHGLKVNVINYKTT